MAQKPTSLPTYVQLELLKIVWRLGEANSREVMKALPRRRKLAYTTVMTTLRGLERKGYLTHTVRDRAYVYRPTVTEDQVSRGMLRRMVNRLFDASPELLLVKLLETTNLSEEELEVLRQRIEAAKRKKRGS